MLFSLSANAQTLPNFSHQGISPIQNNSTVDYNPSAPRLVLQFGSGVLFGALGGIGGGLVGGAIAERIHPKDNWAPLGYAFIGLYAGYTMGSALGVHIVASSEVFKPSYGLIIIGSTIGAGIAVAALNAGADGLGSLVIAISAPIIGGMVANSWSIKKRDSKMSSALLNISSGTTTIASPTVQISQVGNFNLFNKRPATIKLLKISL